MSTYGSYFYIKNNFKILYSEKDHQDWMVREKDAIVEIKKKREEEEEKLKMKEEREVWFLLRFQLKLIFLQAAKVNVNLHLCK